MKRESKSFNIRAHLFGVIAFIVFAAMIAVMLTLASRLWSGSELPQKDQGEKIAVAPSKLANFSLTERGGGTITLGQLKGRIWLANFIFSRCPGPCVVLSARFEDLQGELKKAGFIDVRLVTVTVDPEHDTPQVLARFAEKFNADRERWLFLTGDRAAIYKMIQQNFRLVVAENNKPDAPLEELFIHSTKIALVGPQGLILKYYDSTDASCVQRIMVDIRALKK